MQDDPTWYDGTREYSGECEVCLVLGTAFRSMDWEEAQENVLAMFSEFGCHLKWEEARPVIYFAWKQARERGTGVQPRH